NCTHMNTINTTEYCGEVLKGSSFRDESQHISAKRSPGRGGGFARRVTGLRSGQSRIEGRTECQVVRVPCHQNCCSMTFALRLPPVWGRDLITGGSVLRPNRCLAGRLVDNPYGAVS